MSESETEDTHTGEDRGFPFELVRIVLPAESVVQSLAPNLRGRVRENIERARRIFRSRTLPSLETDGRLCASVFDLFGLSSKIEAAIIEGVDDKEALAKLALPPPSEPISEDVKPAMRVNMIFKDEKIELRFAADLLGNYWYRH
jgi:hypothetical protein